MRDKLGKEIVEGCTVVAVHELDLHSSPGFYHRKGVLMTGVVLAVAPFAVQVRFDVPEKDKRIVPEIQVRVSTADMVVCST